MVLSRSSLSGLLLLASFILCIASTSASDELSAAADTHVQGTDTDSKTDATLASTQYHPVYESHEPERREYHHSDNSKYYTSRSRHDDRHDDPNNQYYISKEQQHHAYAEESERYHSSEQYEDRQYKQYKPSYEQYEARDSYHEQEHQAHDGYKQFEESYESSYLQTPTYNERNVVQVCLQAYAAPAIDATTRKITQEFVCCNGPTLDDSCIRNSTYNYGSSHDAYNAYEREDSTSFMDTVLTPQIAAVCTFDYQNQASCPSWAQQSTYPFTSPGCVSGVTAKCAFTKYASQCGCPAHAQGLEFESHAYLQAIEGISCGYNCRAGAVTSTCLAQSSAAVTTGGPYSGIAVMVQGGFSEAFTRGEPADIEGSLEFTRTFIADDGSRGPTPTANLLLGSPTGQEPPIFKSGQMKIRLAAD